MTATVLTEPAARAGEATHRRSFRILCTGDLHAGAGAEYGRQPGDRLREQQDVWRTILLMSRANRCDLVLFAGDAFEKRRPTPDELLALELPLVDHHKAGGPPVVAIAGNHDLSAVEAGCGLDVLAEAGLLILDRRPTVRWHGRGERLFAVAALPWGPTSRVVASVGGGDRDDINEYAAEILVKAAGGLRAQIAESERRMGGRDVLKVLLTHFSLSGGLLPSGLPVTELREPVLPLLELVRQGWDAMVAGHIHRPAMLSLSGAADPVDETVVSTMHVLHVGSPMALNFGEANVRHGCWQLDLHDDGEPHRLRFLPLKSRRFVTVDVDFTSGDDFSQIEERHNTEYLEDAVVRVRYRATADEARRLDHGRMRQALERAGASKVYAIQPTILREERPAGETFDETMTDLEAVQRWLASVGVNGERAEGLLERTAGYMREARG